MKIARHKWVLGKALVSRGVLDHQNIVTEYRIPAKRYVARRFRHRKIAPRLEEIAVGIHEGDKSDRNAEPPLGHICNSVELRLRLGVNDPVPPKRLKALRFI